MMFLQPFCIVPPVLGLLLASLVSSSCYTYLVVFVSYYPSCANTTNARIIVIPTRTITGNILSQVKTSLNKSHIFFINPYLLVDYPCHSLFLANFTMARLFPPPIVFSPHKAITLFVSIMF